MELDYAEKYKSELTEMETSSQFLNRLFSGCIRTKSENYRALLGRTLIKKISDTLKSYLKLLPESSYYKNEVKDWDVSSVAALTRSVIENFNMLFYLAVEEVSEDEKMLRILLCELHSEVEKVKMFISLDIEHEIVREQQIKIKGLKDEVEKNKFFMTFDYMKREELLKANKALYLSNKEIARKVEMDIDKKELDFIYRYTSNFLHSSPFAVAEEESERENIETMTELVRITKLFIENTISFVVKIFPNAKKVGKIIFEDGEKGREYRGKFEKYFC